MIILAIKTDHEDAELRLLDGRHQIDSFTWPAGRQLGESLHQKIADLLAKSIISLKEIQGIAVYQGPGSFTSLRIGLSIANGLAQGLGIPIVGATTNNWLQLSTDALLNGQNNLPVSAEYGADPHITLQKK